MANPLKALFDESGKVTGLSELAQNDKIPVGNLPTGTGSDAIALGNHNHSSISGNAATASRLANAVTINGVHFDGSADITINSQDAVIRIAASEKGVANGVCPLGNDNRVAAAYLPSYVDDVLEFDNRAAFPVQGESGKVYIALDTNAQYRWSGSAYIVLTASPGSTDAVPEGSVNLYFTSARAQSAVTAITGNAGTATKLQIPRTISGVSFDGSNNIVVPYSGLSGTPTLGSAAAKDTPSSGNASTTQVVLGSDSRLSNASTINSGLMSATDKTKLDGITSGANSYTLPVATTSTLGGVKQGTNINIAADGTLSANVPNTYTLPIATSSVLGGIKLGTGFSTTSDGTVNVDLSTLGTTTALAPTISGTLTNLGITGSSVTVSDMKLSTVGMTAVPTHLTWNLYSDIACSNLIWTSGEVAVGAITSGSATHTLNFSTASPALQMGGNYYLKVKWKDSTYGYSDLSGIATLTMLNIKIGGLSAVTVSEGQSTAFSLDNTSITYSATGATVTGSTVTYTAAVGTASGSFTVSSKGFSQIFTVTVQSVAFATPTLSGVLTNLGITGSNFTVSNMSLSTVGVTATPTHLTWYLYSDSACLNQVWTSGEAAVGTITSGSATHTLNFSTASPALQMGGNYYLKVKWKDSAYGYSGLSSASTLTMLNIAVGSVTALTAYEGQTKSFSLDNTSITYAATGATISGSTVTYAAAVGATSGSFTVSSKGFSQTFSVTLSDVSVVTPTITVTGLNASNQITTYADVAVSSSAFAINPNNVTGVTDSLASATWTLLDGTTSVWTYTGTGLTATIPATTFVFGKQYTLRLKHTGSKYGDSANVEQLVTFSAFQVTGATTVPPGSSATYTIGNYNAGKTYTITAGGGSASAIVGAGTFTYTASSTTGTYLLIVTVDSKAVTISIKVSSNDIGIAGERGFGVGVFDGTLLAGLTPLSGCNDKSSDNYGNYQYSDNSIMVYIPKFYYRWGVNGTTPSSLYNLYGDNSVQIAPSYQFANESDANSAGWFLHRAFIDGGVEKDGFWVDKYHWSKNTVTNSSGIASSVSGGYPLSSSGAHNPFSGVNARSQTPANAYYGAFSVAKTRGTDFFPLSIFQFKALAMLSLAHAQACKVNNSNTYCAWGDLGSISSTSPGNFPKGNNSNTLKDVNDSTVTFTGDGYGACAKTGSGVPLNKTTHNGQNCGVADLNGNLSQVAPGLTSDGTSFYLLKRSVQMKNLTGGTTLTTDAFGNSGISTNYNNVGTTLGASVATFYGDNLNSRVFSNTPNGSGFSQDLACAGVPITATSAGSALFGSDYFGYAKSANLACWVGLGYFHTTTAGIWTMDLSQSYSSGFGEAGGRSGLYPA